MAALAVYCGSAFVTGITSVPQPTWEGDVCFPVFWAAAMMKPLGFRNPLEIIRPEQPQRFCHSANYIDTAGSPGFACNVVLIKT